MQRIEPYFPLHFANEFNNSLIYHTYEFQYHKIWGDLPGFDIPNRNHDRSSPDYPTSYSSYNSDPYEEYFYDAPLASIDAHSMSAQRQTILYRNIPIVISGPDETVSRYENQKNILIVKWLVKFIEMKDNLF